MKQPSKRKGVPSQKGSRGGPRPIKRPDDGRLAHPRTAGGHEITQEMRENVEEWASVGMSQRAIMAKLNLTPGEFRYHYEADFDRGRWKIELALKGKLIKAGLEDNAKHPAIVAALRSMGAYVERVEVTGKDGGAIQTQNVDITPLLENMTDEQLAVLGPVLDAIIAGAGAGQPESRH